MKRIIKIVLTSMLVAGAAFFGYQKYTEYYTYPWTRDGQVRAQVIQVTPRVTGRVVKIGVFDNALVHKGDMLFEIDPQPFIIKVKQIEAEIKRERINLRGRKIEYERVQHIAQRDKGAVSQKDLMRHEINYYKSLARIDSLKEQLNAAKLNLEFTKVYAPVDGYVSNINFQVGDQAVANKPILALVDKNSFWVFGFFRENMIGNIHIGDAVEIVLMAYPQRVIKGKVESIGWGIAHSDGNPGNNLLPKIKPVFPWIRLAQRIPVRVRLSNLPQDVVLRVGLSASVRVLTH